MNTKIGSFGSSFGSGDGYYGWGSLRYFMFEYEYSLTVKHGIPKITWELFAKTEKDKVSIEHILPQTPTKLYWRNQFRQFTAEEIKLLSGALGNLLPLSQSVNSGLQNDSFEDKKHPQSTGRRGYQDGSHSEIEVSKETDWDANRIYDRSVKLLQFMEQRWNISFTDENLKRLVYVDFVHDGREIPGEVTEDVATVLAEATHEQPPKTDLGSAQLQFWTAFADYCHANGRGEDIASRKPLAQHWYDIPVGAIDYHLSFTVTRNKYLSLIIYAYNADTFRRLESKKDAIEESFGHELDWYSSRESSVAKRIVYKCEMDVFNINQQPEIFAWMVAAYDSLYAALEAVGE